MELRIDFNQGRSDLPCFELNEAEIDAVSGGATLVNITPVGRCCYDNGGYYEVQRWTFSDGTVQERLVRISVA